jgi:hypothetical protein
MALTSVTGVGRHRVRIDLNRARINRLEEIEPVPVPVRKGGCGLSTFGVYSSTVLDSLG